MVIRVLMHPLAEDVFIFLSLGLILLSAGLLGSLFWTLPDDDAAPQVSAVTAHAVPTSAPADQLLFACAERSGLVRRPTPIDCQP